MLGFKQALLVMSLSAMVLVGCKPSMSEHHAMNKQTTTNTNPTAVTAEAKNKMDACLDTAFASYDSDQSCLNFIAMRNENKLGDILKKNDLLLTNVEVSRNCIADSSIPCIVSGVIIPKAKRAYEIPSFCGQWFYLYSNNLVNWTPVQFEGMEGLERTDMTGYALEQDDSDELNRLVRAKANKDMGCF